MSGRTCPSIENRSISGAASRVAQQVASRVGVHVRRLHRHHRIQQRHEVRTRGDAIEQRAGTPVGRIKVRGRRRREVPARGGAEQADAIRPHAEFGRARSDQPHGAQHVLQRCRMTVVCQAVFEREHGDTPAGQEVDRAGHLVVHRQPGVGAPGARDHRGAGRRAWRRSVVGERRIVDVGNAPIDHTLGSRIGAPARHALRPNRNQLRGNREELRWPQHRWRDAHGVDAALEPRHEILPHADRRATGAKRLERDLPLALQHAIHEVLEGAAGVGRSKPRAIAQPDAVSSNRASVSWASP